MRQNERNGTHDETDVFAIKLSVVQLPDDVLHLILRVELHQPLTLGVDLHVPRLGVLAEQANSS